MSEENKNNEWPPELDALVAAPQHHKLLFENEFVRVLDTNIQPGEETNLHTHQHPASLYILNWSDFIRYDADRNVLADSKALGLNYSSGTALWTGALSPHLLKNVGHSNLHVISVEIKTTS
jgi:quercetin dioxygenase-like cupin family protein